MNAVAEPRPSGSGCAVNSFAAYRLLWLLALVSLSWTGETRYWSQGDYADFEKGHSSKVSLTSDGRLRLAPRFEEIFDSASIYLWALAEDSKGNLYAGGGGPGGPGARLYVLPPEGKGKTLASWDDLEVHAVAVGPGDQVYAATSPDGKVYKILPGGKPEVFYDPRAKYIWAMVFDSRGNLYVATGDRGDIHRISPQGKGEAFFKTGETHARALAIDPQGNLVVGTEPGGLIIRVNPKGEGFVLYQAARREITAVALAADGSIYAAGVGAKGPAPAVPPVPPAQVAPATQPSPAPTSLPGTAQQRQVQPMPAPIPSLAAPVVAGGSEIYRIGPDGFPRKVWSHAQHIAYSIVMDADGRPVIGTGNKGLIIRLDSDLVHSELLNASPTQVTCLLAGRGAKLYAATGNVGKLFRIGPGSEAEGTFESDVFDAAMFSYWGRLTFRARMEGGQVSLETRSGNLERPQKDWSAWSPAATAAEGGRIGSPPARFLQWRATLKASRDGRSPELEAVDAAYLPKNVAPVVAQIEITPANYRFPAQTLTLTPSTTLTLPPLGRPPRPASASLSTDTGATSMQYAKGFLGARWAATDDNQDSLLYSVHIRGVNESEWKLLKDQVKEKHLSWDSTGFPDGEYRLRVAASDAPTNPPAQALTAELISDPFDIDNTPPEITGLTAAPAGGKLEVRWKAADALSVIEKAEYSVNGGEWTLIEPTTRLSDSRQHDYLLALEPASGERAIAVRVTDSADNFSLAKIVVR
ncbi:MAG: hypothetical protein FJW34_05305 [Acidobacteria bacterium]|nr:hypothetical protein [Acidobacteriota bacterium]